MAIGRDFTVLPDKAIYPQEEQGLVRSASPPRTINLKIKEEDLEKVIQKLRVLVLALYIGPRLEDSTMTALREFIGSLAEMLDLVKKKDKK